LESICGDKQGRVGQGRAGRPGQFEKKIETK